MEKGTLTGLVVVLTLILLPLAHALNCTKFKGDERSLCKEINPLDISEKEKRNLMKPDVYGNTHDSGQEINLDLEFSENETQTTLEIYEKNIGIAIKIGIFILLNYFLFSFLTKPSKMIRWLRVDS